MIRFAFKLLIAMVAVGYVVRLAEPAPAPADEPQLLAATHIAGMPEEQDQVEIARQLSSFTNVQIVVSQTTRDVAGFCERQALACQAGRELIVRAAAGIRDVAASIAGEEEKLADVSGDSEEEYMPLREYRGTYPILPEAPPPRYTTF